MTPGPYEIPANILSDMRVLSDSLRHRSRQLPALTSAQQRTVLLAIYEKINGLADFPFSQGNTLVLLKPDMTFGYVRMGVDISLHEPATTPDSVIEAAARVRAWLDAIGHKYPTARQ